MQFRDAVRATAGLADQYRFGLQAVRRADRQRIRCRNSGSVTGSVNVDSALRESHPDDHRWDYAIGFCEARQAEVVFWVEVHPASSHHVEDVLEKLRWLKQWLSSEAPRLEEIPPRFVWVASGGVALSPGSRQRRQLAGNGIHLVVERLVL